MTPRLKSAMCVVDAGGYCNALYGILLYHIVPLPQMKVIFKAKMNDPSSQSASRKQRWRKHFVMKMGKIRMTSPLCYIWLNWRLKSCLYLFYTRNPSYTSFLLCTNLCFIALELLCLLIKTIKIRWVVKRSKRTNVGNQLCFILCNDITPVASTLSRYIQFWLLV